MKKVFLFFFTLFIPLVFLSCDFKLVDTNKQEPLEIGDLLQDMVAHKDIIYLISKDTIYTIRNSNHKLIKETTLKPFTQRVDFVSIKKVLDNIYILDENRKIHIWQIDNSDGLDFINTINLTYQATSFEVFSDNTILLANSHIKTELIDIEPLSTEEDSYIKFNTIENQIHTSFLANNTELYTISNLNNITKYDISNIKQIRQDMQKTVPENINSISSNNKHLFLSSDNNIYLYDFTLNKISSLSISGVSSLLFDENYIYLSKGLNGISKIDISDVENLKDVQYNQEEEQNYKKILFTQDKKDIIIMLSDDIKIISKGNL